MKCILSCQYSNLLDVMYKGPSHCSSYYAVDNLEEFEKRSLLCDLADEWVKRKDEERELVQAFMMIVAWKLETSPLRAEKYRNFKRLKFGRASSTMYFNED